MASTTRVPKTEITGLYGALLKRMTRRMLGSVPEAAEVMWHHPAIFRDMMAFGRRAERWDRLDPALGTLATMAAAGVVGCSFCLDLHSFMARDKGLDEAKARQVPRWRESDAFTPLERRAMAYAEAMSQTPPAVTDEMSVQGLMEVLAPDVVVVADGGGLAAAVRRPVEGAERAATLLARFAEHAPRVEIATLLLNGSVAARIDPGGALDTAITFVVEGGRIARIQAIRNPQKLGRLDVGAALRR